MLADELLYPGMVAAFTIAPYIIEPMADDKLYQVAMIAFWVLTGALLVSYPPVVLGCYAAALMLIYLFLKDNSQLVKRLAEKIKEAAIHDRRSA